MKFLTLWKQVLCDLSTKFLTLMLLILSLPSLSHNTLLSAMKAPGSVRKWDFQYRYEQICGRIIVFGETTLYSKQMSLFIKKTKKMRINIDLQRHKLNDTKTVISWIRFFIKCRINPGGKRISQDTSKYMRWKALQQ